MSEEVVIPAAEIQPQATEGNVAPAQEVTPTPETEKIEAVAPKTFTEEEVKAKVDAEAAKIRNRYDRKMERQRVESETRAKVTQELQSVKLPANAPTREQYASDVEYIEGLATWKAEQVATGLVEKKLKERDELSNKAKQEEYEAARNENWLKREDTFSEAVGDYQDVLNSVAEEITTLDFAARVAIVESELGPNISYYLGKNPEEIDRIAGLTPLRQVAEIGKLEDKVAKTKPVKASNAPDPIKPVGSKATIEPDPNKMTDKQFAQWRKEQIKARNSY